MAQLADLIKDFPVELPALALAQMHLDSRRIKPGDLFVAIQGHEIDGRRFISQAIAAGAAAILSHGDVAELIWHSAEQGQKAQKVPEVRLPELNSRLPALASAFYDNPGAAMDIVGVTGTNGKSSVCAMVAQLADQVNGGGAMVGTLGWGRFDQVHETANTTPDAVVFQQILRQLADEQVTTLGIEVSSHGLVQGRVDAVPIKTAVFTNLSREHLDYHGDMDSYFEAKKRLFVLPGLAHAVVNVDSNEGRILTTQISTEVSLCAVGAIDSVREVGSEHFIGYRNLSRFADGLRCELESSWGSADFYLPLLGDFNLDNFLCAAGALCLNGAAFEAVITAAAKLKPAAGRMELFHKEGLPALVVDYAHTPDALEKALLASRHHCRGQLWCVFGCGGDRDKGKRPLMAKVAEAHAEQLIVTADNPRTEPQAQITSDILRGLSEHAPVSVIEDRTKAITEAFRQAANEDLILVAGKGHEDYQVVGEQVLTHDDRLIARQLLEEAI
ncbi:UDP-N-acetylmuramoyl-L-alanyl-D-glutamate--2,6-diaminopimelate ligase [Corallincola platygyrae]|uniref:UDP-N-acetylmuramoyl-L-alanyl-D-glutamate--2,6-diaminopimelate ligase n=1 Tax=Corallincola platygyrae TaxID=1193278 RepID=A0ABW4XPR2_9GAMM